MRDLTGKMDNGSIHYIDSYKVNKSESVSNPFSQPELILLDLGIIERKDRLAFHLEHFDPVALRTDKQAQSIKKLLKTDVERLEALHKKLSNMISQLDITNKENNE